MESRKSFTLSGLKRKREKFRPYPVPLKNKRPYFSLALRFVKLYWYAFREWSGSYPKGRNLNGLNFRLFHVEQFPKFSLLAISSNV